MRVVLQAAEQPGKKLVGRNLLLAGSLCALTLVGCGGPFGAKLSGDVSLDGERLGSGKMMFTPQQADGTTAYAGIDSGGRYRAQTGREFGLKPGEYSVAVVAREKPPQREPGSTGPRAPGELITPQWYSQPGTSGLTVSVEPGSNRFDIELSSTPPDGWEESKANNTRRRRR